MLARIRKAMENKEEGFTLIELLVVMIIIGILAAIAIPVFLSQKKKAYETSLKADLKSIATNIATANVDNPGDLVASSVGQVWTLKSYTTAPATGLLNTYNVGLSNGNTIVKSTVNAGTGAYCVEEQHTATDPHWTVQSDGVTSQTLQQGVCP